MRVKIDGQEVTPTSIDAAMSYTANHVESSNFGAGAIVTPAVLDRNRGDK